MNYQILALNLGSGGVMAKAFLDENLELDLKMDLTTVGGFLVMASIIALNVVKTYRELKLARREKGKIDND